MYHDIYHKDREILKKTYIQLDSQDGLQQVSAEEIITPTDPGNHILSELGFYL